MLLNKEKIIVNLASSTQRNLAEFHCFESVDSTNRWLFDYADTKDVHGCVCIADSQTAGVGRAGKSWVGSALKNILMSVGYQFDLELSKLSSLSLVTGIAIVNALEKLGVSNLALKWPNDVFLNDAKLAGILIQTKKHPVNGYWAIVGIGLNLELTTEDKKSIPQAVAELSSLGFDVEKREIVIAKCIDELLSAFEHFNRQGLEYFLNRWDELDYLKNQSVQLIQSDQQTTGQYMGINNDGAVRMVLSNNQIKEYYVGEISLRKKPSR